MLMLLKRESQMGVKRGFVSIAVLLAATLLLGGCIAGKRVDNNAANISIVANRTNNLKAEVRDLRSQVDKLVIQVAGLNEKLDSLAGTRKPDADAAGAKAAPEKVDREVILLEQELSIVERRLENLEQSRKTPAPNIKVLAGTTDIQPAKDMAAFLSRNGFPVQAVDYASGSGYKYDTGYYAEGDEGHAQQLAEALGGKTIIKPLTWKSVFDVIAVKGGPR